MVEALSYVDTYAALAELLAIGAGLVILTLVAVCKKLSASRPASQKAVAEEAEEYVQRYGDGALRRIGAEMHQERIAHGIGPRYRSLRAICEHLCRELTSEIRAENKRSAGARQRRKAPRPSRTA